MTESRVWSPAELMTATGGATIGEPTGDRIVTDSRGDVAGAVFLALTGDHHDGHDHVRSVLAAGATGAVVSRAWWEGVRTEAVRPLLVVEDPLRALQDLAAHHRRGFDVPVIAVTGSSGKTTTKELLAAALSPLGPVHRTAGNYNNHIGVPLTLLGLTGEHRAAVIEMGMNAPGEIDLLSRMTAPTTAVITNVSEAHLERLRDRKGVARAKAEIVAGLDPKGALVIPYGDPDLTAALKSWFGPQRTFGANPRAQLHPTTVAVTVRGTTFTLPDGTRVVLRLLGAHNVRNALAALAAAAEAGVDPHDAAPRLEQVEPLPGRLKLRQAGGVTVLDDSYNANPASLRAAFELLRTIPAQRRFALVGDMLELGPSEEHIHFNVGDIASEVDGLVTLGPLAARFAHGAMQAGLTQRKWHRMPDHAAAAEKLEQLLESGDALLVKGSRGAHLEQTLDDLLQRLGGED